MESWNGIHCQNVFDDSSVKTNLLDLKNADAFAGLVNDGTEATLPTYRQTGAVFVLVVNYFNYPRDLSELGYLFDFQQSSRLGGSKACARTYRS